jgi:sulfate permease, SulP family
MESLQPDVGTEANPFVSDWRAMAARFGGGWKTVFLSGSLLSDVLAGLTVAAVALPLNLALAVASGVPASAGLIAGAVGGFVAAAFGGSAFQVTGPAAALSVMVLAVAAQFGATGVAAAALMVGVIQLATAFTRAGHLAKFVPESVLAGFTTGVGLKLFDSQVPEFLGFDYRVSELAAMMHRPAWLHEVEWTAVVCGLTVAFIVVTSQQFRRFPAAIVGIAGVTFIANYVGWEVTRVGEVPSEFPSPAFRIVPDDQWLDLMLAALPLGILAGVESLLSASVADRLAKRGSPHHPSLELFGQGLANIAVSVFGGMTVSGVVVRSSVNVQSGAKTRLSALLHAAFLGGAVLYASTYLARIPLAALAGLLCVVGYRLIEVKTLRELVAHDKVEALAFVAACVGTVTGHLMLGLVAGLAIHAAGQYLKRSERAEREQTRQERRVGIRAVLGQDKASARQPVHQDLPSKAARLPNVRGRAVMPKSAFVHPQATVIGRVVLGENVHIAAGASVRADEGTPFFIGDDSNIQDGVVIHALKEKRVQVGAEEWAVYVGRNVSMAHNALVHGPCFVGDGSFIGFKAVVHDAVVGRGCFIGIGSVVVGVEIPDGRFVPHGQIIDSLDEVAALPLADESQMHFNADVVDVNRGLAAAYHALDGAAESTDFEWPKKPSQSWEQRWNVVSTRVKRF